MLIFLVLFIIVGFKFGEILRLLFLSGFFMFVRRLLRSCVNEDGVFEMIMIFMLNMRS